MIAELAADHGVEAVSVTRIVQAAAVSRRTFYEWFYNRDDCLLAAIERALALAAERASGAAAGRAGWVDRTRAGLLALLEFFDAHPKLARLCVVDWHWAGRRALERRRELLSQLERVLDEGREGSRLDPPPLTAEGVLGGAVGVLHARLLERDPPRLTECANELMSFILLPYRGVAASRRELERPRPRPMRSKGPRKIRGRRAHPLAELDMRLTYRTARVLSAIARAPDRSNSEISARAGVVDPGQISKLLARLARLQLIENTGPGYRAGGRNAWRLTATGRELERAISNDALAGGSA